MATDAKTASRSAKAKDERQLDKSLEDSFPASDPSSVTRAPQEQRFVAPPAHAKTRKTPAKATPAKTTKAKTTKAKTTKAKATQAEAPAAPKSDGKK